MTAEEHRSVEERLEELLLDILPLDPVDPVDDCRFQLYLFDPEVNLLLPILEPGHPRPSPGFAPGQGAVGEAWQTGERRTGVRGRRRCGVLRAVNDHPPAGGDTRAQEGTPGAASSCARQAALRTEPLTPSRWEAPGRAGHRRPDHLKALRDGESKSARGLFLRLLLS